MSAKVVIFGTGEFATVARVYFDQDSDYEVVAFTVHEEYVDETELEGLQAEVATEAVYRDPDKLKEFQITIAEREAELEQANEEWANWDVG